MVQWRWYRLEIFNLLVSKDITSINPFITNSFCSQSERSQSLQLPVVVVIFYKLKQNGKSDNDAFRIYAVRLVVSQSTNGETNTNNQYQRTNLDDTSYAKCAVQ